MPPRTKVADRYPHPVELNLTRAHGKKLLLGKGIRLTRSHLISQAPGVMVHMNDQQLGAVHRMAERGGGTNFRMLPDQIFYHVKPKVGGGFFGDIWKGIKKAGKFVGENLKPIGKAILSIPGVRAIADRGAALASNLAREAVGTVSPTLGDKVGNFLSDKAKQGLDAVGSGRRRSRAAQAAAVQPMDTPMVQLPVGAHGAGRKKRGGAIMPLHH